MADVPGPKGSRSAGAAVRPAAAESVWRLEERSPELYAAITAAAPWLPEALARFGEAMPAADRIEPFDTGEHVRPYRHLRAFYRRHEQGGTLAFKGTELHAADLVEKLEGLRAFRVDYPARGRSLFSVIEHFPIVERKVPLAVSLPEALEDAESALALQSLHLRRFGALARAPVPLRVARWPAADVSRFRAALLPRLSPRAAKIVEAVLAEELGCLVYHYPTVPLRVAHLDGGVLGGGFADYQGRRQALGAITDPAATVDAWLDLATRMLVLGLLPGSIESIGIGHCLEAQNAVIDGGFVDLGSMKRVADVTDERELVETVLAALADLAKTIRGLLLGSLVDPEAEYRNPSLVMMLMAGRVFEEVKRRFAGYAGSAGHAGIDPRLAAFFAEGPLFQGLDRDLRSLYRPAIPGGRHASGAADR